MTSETGLFWLPGTPDETVRGRLETTDDGVTTVELMGSLTSAMKVVSVNPTTGVTRSEPADDPLDLLVHGILAGRPRRVTLIDCWTPRRDGAFGDQVLRVGRLVRGTHISGDKDRFTGVRLQVTDLEAWADLSDPSAETIPNVGLKVSWNFTDIPTVPISQGGQLTLAEGLRRHQQLHAGVHLTRQLFVELREIGDLSYKQIDANFVTPIVGYLSFAIGATTPLVALQLKYGNEWLEVTHGGMAPGAKMSGDYREPLLPLGVAGLEVLSKFLDVYRKVGPAVPVIRDLISNTHGLTLDTQVLELTTLAEGLHERLFPEDERMSKADAKRVRTLVQNALEQEKNPRYADIVNGTVLNYLNKPNYKSRLTRLADEAASAMPNVCGNRDEWVQRVDAARNNFAHRKEGFIPAESIDEMYAISQSLRWLLMGNILLASGVPADVLNERLQQDSRYYYFRQNVRSAAPVIYSE